ELPFSALVKYLLLSTVTVIPGIIIAQYIVDTVRWHRITETVAILCITGFSYAVCSLVFRKNFRDILIQKVLRQE
ncbi:MAG: hypothetical protein D3922_11780, partial [Candidatus Electrothrix sp. AR1]|nr:hypothetical protein [Candidatus Electrothrix sp. AR1]